MSREYICISQYISEIKYDNFCLTTVQDEHIEQIRNWRNSQMLVLRQKEAITTEQQKKYFEHSIWSSLNEEKPKNIILSFLENGNIIGYGGLVHISWEDLRSEVSFLLNPIFINDNSVYSHYFSIFLSMLKNLAFDKLGFNRLFTETFAFRNEHIKILEENNFVLEGRMQKHVIINNVPIDSLLHGCLKDRK